MHELTESERWVIYRVAAYVAWCDGRLVAEEVSTARALAEELHLAGEGHDPGAALRSGPPALLELEVEQLGLRARRVTYAAAAWMSLSDGRLHRAEDAVLRMLRHRLLLEDQDAYLLFACVTLAMAQAATAPPRTVLRAVMAALEDLRDGSGPRRRPRAPSALSQPLSAAYNPKRSGT